MDFIPLSFNVVKQNAITLLFKITTYNNKTILFSWFDHKPQTLVISKQDKLIIGSVCFCARTLIQSESLSRQESLAKKHTFEIYEPQQS